jgi:hypothetical protein
VVIRDCSLGYAPRASNQGGNDMQVRLARFGLATVVALVIAACGGGTSTTTRASTGYPELDACIDVMVAAVADIDFDSDSYVSELNDVFSQQPEECAQINDDFFDRTGLDPVDAINMLVSALPPEVADYLGNTIPDTADETTGDS